MKKSGAGGTPKKSLKKWFFIKTGVQKNKGIAIKLSIWYNVSDQTNINRRELWLTYIIPQYT